MELFNGMESIQCFYCLTNNGVFLATSLLPKNNAYVGRAQVMHVSL